MVVNCISYIINFVLFSQEKREKKQAARAKNEYDHTMSRGGYPTLTRKLEKLQHDELMKVAESDPSVLTTPPPPINRRKKFIEGQRHRDGSFVNEKVAAVAQRIVSNIPRNVSLFCLPMKIKH